LVVSQLGLCHRARARSSFKPWTSARDEPDREESRGKTFARVERAKFLSKIILRGDKFLSESFDALDTNNCLNLGRIR
jgi:hypothetical protein